MEEEAVEKGIRNGWDADRQRGQDRLCVCVCVCVCSQDLLSLLFSPSNICSPFQELAHTYPTRERGTKRLWGTYRMPGGILHLAQTIFILLSHPTKQTS